MNRLFGNSNVFASIAALLLLGWASSCLAQFTEPKPTELRKSLIDLLRQKKLDDAIAAVTKASDHPNAPPDVAESLWMVARFLYTNDKPNESLVLLKIITERFPTTPTASLAWCGMGQVYGKLGDNEKMITALERGITARPAFTETNIMDAGDTQSYACQVLGNHYVANRQWEKALHVFTLWRPDSWCGNCLQSMQEHRAHQSMLCRVHLSQFGPVVDQAWREVAGTAYSSDDLGAFTLVRLYAEAGQLEDLQVLALRLVEDTCLKFPVDQAKMNQHRLRIVLNQITSLSSAIDNAKQRDPDVHVQAIQSAHVSRVVKHIARWSQLTQPRLAVHDLELSALRGESNPYSCLELLAAIDSPESRQALVQLAVNGDIYRQQMICGLIRNWMKDPLPQINQVVARVPPERAVQTNWNIEGKPTYYKFYESWPVPPQKSLSTTLPTGLFDRKTE